MKMIDPVIAAINDSHNLNDSQVINILSEILDKKGADGVTPDVVLDYLKIQKIESSMDRELVENVLSQIQSADIKEYEQYLNEVKNKGIKTIPFYSDKYPEKLLNISSPPLMLYVRGDVSCIYSGVAVVGTRSAHDHRVEFAKEVGKKLVKMGYPVTSGLANGIDEAAHEGAIEASGETNAILPGDVETIRPASNRQLGEKISQNGALVAEMSDKESIHRGRFVKRNRITSGMSDAVIIVASGETGGTVHQANFAKAQDRPRFIYDPEEDDGQSPENIHQKGFVAFEHLDELEELLSEEFAAIDGSPGKRTTIDDYY